MGAALSSVECLPSRLLAGCHLASWISAGWVAASAGEMCSFKPLSSFSNVIIIVVLACISSLLLQPLYNHLSVGFRHRRHIGLTVFEYTHRLEFKLQSTQYINLIIKIKNKTFTDISATALVLFRVILLTLFATRCHCGEYCTTEYRYGKVHNTFVSVLRLVLFFSNVY